MIFSNCYCFTIFFLKIVNRILVQLEGLHKNSIIDGRIRPKDCICYGDNSRILTIEMRKSNNIGFAYIKLEVKETKWEYNVISLV